MPSAPTLTIDGAGVLHWTNPATPPTTWVILGVYPDHTWNYRNNYLHTQLGSLNSFDAHSIGWVGGLCLQLVGLDAVNNVILQPSYLIGAVTKNQ